MDLEMERWYAGKHGQVRQWARDHIHIQSCDVVTGQIPKVMMRNIRHHQMSRYRQLAEPQPGEVFAECLMWIRDGCITMQPIRKRLDHCTKRGRRVPTACRPLDLLEVGMCVRSQEVVLQLPQAYKPTEDMTVSQRLKHVFGPACRHVDILQCGEQRRVTRRTRQLCQPKQTVVGED